MKKIIFLCFAAVLFSCTTSIETTPEKAGLDPQVALDVINDYVRNCNERKGSDAWVENQKLLTDDYKRAYQKMVKEAYEADPELGLDFDPIFDAQDYSDEGYELHSFDSKTGLVVVQGADSDQVSLRVKIVGDKCLVDGSGAIRMDQK